MTSRIGATFERLAQEGRCALMPYLTVGYPERDSVLELVPALIRGGADMLEIGMPFSDPLADGATVQRTTEIALQNGITTKDCIETVAALRDQGITVPLLLMGYYNPILQYGLEAFVRDAATAGVDGFIIPDLSPEESQEFRNVCSLYNLDCIFLLAPTTTEQRMQKIVAMATGFIYCVALRGVTGARSDLADDLADFLERVQAQTSLPRAVGVGISRPEHVARVARIAEGAICGSALLDYLGTLQPTERVTGAEQFIRAMREAADEAVKSLSQG